MVIKSLIIITLLVLIFNVFIVKSHDINILNEQEEAQQEPGLYRIFHNGDAESLHFLKSVVKATDYDHFRSANSYDAYLTDVQYNLINSLSGLKVIEIHEPHKNPKFNRETERVSPIMSTSGDIQYNAYPSHQELINFMLKIHKKYPTITKLYSIGKSSQGRDLLVMDISQNANEKRMVPYIKLIGNIHGDEVAGRQCLLYLIDHLCYSYTKGLDKDVKQILENTVVSILPSMNPDGYEAKKRYNGNNFDLNRNFPDKYTLFNNILTTQPETVAVMDWSKSRNYILGCSIHGGSLVVNYPYDTNKGLTDYPSGIESPSPDDNIFRRIALTYAMNNPKMFKSNEFFAGITNGANWYSLNGGMQDWNYDFTGNFEVTIEMSYRKTPLPRELPGHWYDNLPALKEFLLIPLNTGVYGTVLNTRGQPITSAKIHVEGIDHPIPCGEYFGDYYRLLDIGLFNLTATADKYKPQTKQVFLDTIARKELIFNLEDEDSKDHNDQGVYHK
ncbi:hypothetical protein CYY_004178 [Polysphondylium violaceum]|uniref:Peptidase M14 domain-containing protein n=1 Tax=Polysphondylium violaceum TaxID=133409 RepID=A0A8J4PWK9_9MYCE|nr:hypothetical protein CYY_004178 [Polysphondylium violaceum]